MLEIRHYYTRDVNDLYKIVHNFISLSGHVYFAPILSPRDHERTKTLWPRTNMYCVILPIMSLVLSV